MAAVTAIAAGVSATAATAGSIMSWQEAQAQKADVEKLKGRRGEQAPRRSNAQLRPARDGAPKAHRWLRCDCGPALL